MELRRQTVNKIQLSEDMLNEKVLKNEPMKYTIEGGADEGN